MAGDTEFKSWGYTQINVQKLCYKWTISNFSFSMGGIQKRVTSPVFSLEANEALSWCLRVYPNGVDEESKDYLSVYLELLSYLEKPVRAKFEFWIINSEGEKYQSRKGSKVESFLQYEHRGFKKFLLRGLLLCHQDWFLPEDQLTICCKVSIVGNIFHMPGQNLTPTIKDPRHLLTDDVWELWENSLFTDCCLLVAGHEFKAHKAILAARSPVFRAMFEHEMKETLKNPIEIHN
ncbi:TD and POZ domain-containing protein 3-like, partial [Mus pahari]|uniref:TD and POZ domain-containing protein 3-like n=1 Tax=Mus pahari TaxID=10093 RepID=UPI000A30F76D